MLYTTEWCPKYQQTKANFRATISQSRRKEQEIGAKATTIQISLSWD